MCYLGPHCSYSCHCCIDCSRPNSGEDFDVYLQNVKAQSDAFRGSSKWTTLIIYSVHPCVSSTSPWKGIRVPPCCNDELFPSRTAVWHQRGDSQHRVQLGLHHQDPLHQRRRDLAGSGVGRRGRWGLNRVCHKSVIHRTLWQHLDCALIEDRSHRGDRVRAFSASRPRSIHCSREGGRERQSRHSQYSIFTVLQPSVSGPPTWINNKSIC